MSPDANFVPGQNAAKSIASSAPWVWSGDSVLFRHYPDGTVAATSRGKVGFGRDEAEALTALDRLLRPDLYAPPTTVFQPLQK